MVQRHSTVRRTVTEHSVHPRGTTHGSSGVATDGVVEPRVRRDRSAGSSRRGTTVLVPITARVVRGVVVNPVGSRGLAVGELRRLDLADEDGTAVEQALDGRRGGVLLGVEVVVCAVAAARTQALDVVDVLHRKTLAGERLLGGGGEVQTRGNGDALGGGALDVRRHLLVAAAAVRLGSIQERLVLVIVQAPR